MDRGRQLDQLVRFYKSISFAPSTKRAYAVHRKAYLSFCASIGAAPVPASPQLLCRYAAFLAQRLKYNSIRQYMNIVRLLHKEWGLRNPCDDSFPLDMTLKGIKRHLGTQVCRKAPITPALLRVILKHLDVATLRGASIWAACLLMFFGLLRRSNVLAPKVGFDPDKHLRRSDLHFTPQGLRVQITWTKTIQFKERELTIPYPWDRGNPLCPTQAVFNAVRLSKQTPQEGPALVISDGPDPAPLTPEVFVDSVRQALRAPGRDTTQFAGHSFRRGGAMFGFEQNISLERIRQLGDWKSDSYTAYVLPTDKGLAEATKTMVLATRL